MSTHNICFRAKIRKNVYPCTPQFHYIKVGFNGVFITWTCYHDGFKTIQAYKDILALCLRFDFVMTMRSSDNWTEINVVRILK